jgi:rod shape determining protein RodA
MAWIDRRALQNFDWMLFGLASLLVGIGLANLYSASLAGVEEGLPPEFRRQLMALGVAGAAMLVAMSVDYRRLERWAGWIFVASLALLASTLLLAPLTRGSRSWLIWGPFSFQPAELAKVGLVIMLARWFHDHPPGEVRRLRDLLAPGLLAALPVGLIVLQRDLGVALLTLLVAATYLPFARIPWRAWGLLALAGVLALAGAWRFFLKEYQRGRILDFLDPSRDPLASGYQAIQSKIAIGSGGLLGRGWLEGTQTQLQFLPTQHSDFVFSVLAEEWGFAGAVVVLGLYLVMLLWGLVIARNAKDTFGAMLAVGVVGLLFWPAAINVAMVLGLAPVIGVPLPLFSYGGSALLAALIGLGLLFNVSMRRFLF